MITFFQLFGLPQPQGSSVSLSLPLDIFGESIFVCVSSHVKIARLTPPSQDRLQ